MLILLPYSVSLQGFITVLYVVNTIYIATLMFTYFLKTPSGEKKHILYVSLVKSDYTDLSAQVKVMKILISWTKRMGRIFIKLSE